MKAIVALGLAGAVAVAGAKDIELPPCGMLVGHAVYNYQGLYPGGYGNWLVQHGSPFDLIERTVKEEQGNLIQFWFSNGWRPLTKAAWLDMEELGFKCPQPDWKNLRNLSCDEFPDFAKYEKERAGAGVLRAIRMCETNGLYSQLMYVGGVNEKYTKQFTDSKSYVGYDFGERFTFRSENGGNADQSAPRLDKLADNLVASVRKHCEECRAKGYGNIWCTSANFFMDYEVYGGVDYTLYEDFTCDLNFPSALSRGLARQYGRKLWGGHVANEYYAWISSKNPHFYRMLYSAFACKYVAGAKVLVSESGGWHAQTPGSDSPLNDLPKSRVSFTAKTPSDAELAPVALEAEKLRDLASEEGHWSRSFRKALGDFYRYVKQHGTPEGQPEATFALAKGNYDLEGWMLDGRPKPNSVIAGLHPYAEKHMEWMAGAPEFGWGIAGEVFWPRGQGIFGTKDLNRIFSGTPWGQVDIVSFAYDNITADFLLKNYKTLAFVGWNTCSEKQYRILCDYVKGGGRLLISIPQLSKDLTRNYQAYTKEDLVNGGDFTELCGLKVVDRGPYFYWTGAVKGTSAERWSSAKTHGAYRGILGKVEVSNPQAEPLLYNWENDMNVLYRLPSGKGEVWFINSWYYPGAYNFSYGPDVGPNSQGFVGDILREMARRSRGTAYLTESGEDDPGEECKFVNWSYFPSTKEVILFNVDFEKPHTVDLHFGGKTKTLVLPPNEIVREPSALEKLNDAEMTHVIRPGWENGGEWWNANASTFIYPPAFGYRSVPNAAKYVFTITDDVGHLLSFEAPTPNEPLTNVWPKVSTGLTTVVCDAVDKDGKSVGLAGQSFFWKGAPFKPGSYPKAKRSYAESAAKVYEYVFNMEPMRKCLREGRPDPAYMLNCYPTKIHASVISGMVRYAKAVPEKAADALKLARILADYLLENTEPKGAPLEGFPPTYDAHKEFKRWTAETYAGQTMLLYPAAGGRAYLELYAATGERKYREAAIAIAERYLALQGEDGSWYLKLYLKDGKPVTQNRCLPIGIAEFLEAVYAETKEAKYRTAADRAFAYVERRPLRDWNWEGQFEDVKPTAKYVNLTKHPAGEAAIYMMKRFPTDVKRQALARELLRFCEDQFVCWERPCRPDGTGFKTGRDWVKPGDVTADYMKWLDFPSALEQYYWYIPIDASNAKMINAYLALYRVTKNPLDLAKARALGDTLTRVQFDSGRIPTQMAEYQLSVPMQDWVNCMLAAARSLENLAKED